MGSATALTRQMLLMGASLGIFLAPALADPGEQPPRMESDILQELQVVNVLIRDGHLERAWTVLGELDSTSPALDRVRFHYLRGLTLHRLQRHTEAILEYEAAIAAAGQPPVLLEDGTFTESMVLPDSIFLQIAQCAFQEKDYRKAVEAIREAPGGESMPREAYLMLSQGLWHLSQKEAAWDTLEAGRERFPTDLDMLRTAVFMRCDLGLFQAALAAARTLLQEGTDLQVEDVLLVGEAMRKAGALEPATGFLEEARFRFPEAPEVTQMLARVYQESGRPWMAGLRLEEMTRYHPHLLAEAAEMFRKAGQPLRALFLNEKIQDQEEKMKQRLGILLELERFEEVTRMESRLRRLGLLEDDGIRYALAYAAYRNGELLQAEKNLSGISDPRTFEMGIRLREAIQSCRTGGWLCE